MTRTKHRFFVLLVMTVLALGLAAAWGAGTAAAADNSACFACHGTESSAPSQTIAGKTVSLYVNPTAFAATTHGAQACTACHGAHAEAHDTANRTYGSWARFSASASTDTTATWNFWKVSGDKCVTCHTDPSYAKFFTSDHATAWNMAHTPDGTDRKVVDIVGSDGVTYHADEDYTEANCGRCHMQKNCATCHWKTPIINNPKGTATGGITNLLDLWTDYSATAATAKGALSENAIDWTQNIATHNFRTETDLESSNEVCVACHTGYLAQPDASVPAIDIFGIGMTRHGQSQELQRSGARGVHETLQQCTDCHKSVHDATAPESMLQWRQDHDVNCLDCHPTRKIMGAGVPHQNADCTACHATGVDAILDPDGGGAGVPLLIPRVIKHNAQQGWPTHDLRRDTDCQRCHVKGGNQTGAPAWSSVMAIDVHEDVTAPVTKALKAVSVKRNAKATFKYRVNDVQSTKATVTTKIKNSHGKTMKTYRLGKRTANALLTFKAKITLAKGKYSWTVYAKDEAGNTQASPAGKNKLTVK